MFGIEQHTKMEDFTFGRHTFELVEIRRNGFPYGVEFCLAGMRKESLTSFPSAPQKLRGLDAEAELHDGWHLFYNPDTNVFAILCEPTSEDLLCAAAKMHNRIIEHIWKKCYGNPDASAKFFETTERRRLEWDNNEDWMREMLIKDGIVAKSYSDDMKTAFWINPRDQAVRAISGLVRWAAGRMEVDVDDADAEEYIDDFRDYIQSARSLAS